MKYHKYFTQAVLLFTIPSTAAYPQAEVPAVTFHSQPAEPNIVSKLTLNGHNYSYDDVLILLDQIESGVLEKICSDEDLDRINEFLATLAQEGMISDDPNENYELACDIQDLLQPGDSYEYAFAYGNNYIIAPMLYSSQGEYVLCKSWAKRKWEQTKKFVKKHKKTIIIVAVAAIVVAAVVISGGGAAGAAPGLAGTVGAAKAEQDLNDDESKNKTSSPPPSPQKPADVSGLPSIRENPGVRSAFEDHLSALQSFTSQNQGFMGPNDSRLPFDSTYEENTRILGSVFGHRQLEDPSQHFADSNAKALAHQQIDQKFGTDFGKHYTGSSQPSFTMSPETAFNADLYQFRGERALDVAHYDQAISDLGKTLELNPSNPEAYLGRAKAHLAKGEYDRSLEDYKEYSILKAACAPLKEDFLFRKGFLIGAAQSLHQIAVFADNFANHPIDTSAQVLDALGTLGKLAFSHEWSTIGEALLPDVCELAEKWHTLSREEKAEQGGIVFGKCGSDIFAPIGLGKGLSWSAKEVQGVVAVSNSLKLAEQTLVLDAAVRSGASGQELAEMAAKLAKGERTVLGNLEGALTESARAQSMEMFKKAQSILQPYKGKYLTEVQAREIIHQAGIKTFPKPMGIPENFRVKLSDTPGGMKYVHPEYEGTYVRIMPGKPHSPFPQQREPYVNHRVNGKSLDKFGNVVDNKTAEAHIPLNEFVYRG